MLNLLRKALSHRRYNINVTRGIDEGKDLKDLLPKKTEKKLELKLEARWRLERFFNNRSLSFWQGVFIVYLLIEMPRLVFLPFVATMAPSYFLTGNLFGFLGDLIVPISLLLINTIYKETVKLKNQVNEILKSNTFVAPPVQISAKQLKTQQSVADLDGEYRDRYIEPVMRKTLQYGFDLFSDTKYQLGSGAVPAGIFSLTMILRYVVGVLPPAVFTLADPGIPQISPAYLLYNLCLLSFIWFIAGVVAWTFFMSWIVNIQASGNTVGFRPFESARDYFVHSLALTFKISFSLVILVSWVSPFVLVWSVLPAESIIRQGVVVFVGAFVISMIAAIIISFSFPIARVQKGLDCSRSRALILKKHQLDELERSHDPNMTGYFSLQKHLIDDYKDIRNNPKSVLSGTEVFQILVSILLPIISFLLSRGW